MAAGQQQPPPTFAEIHVYTDDDDFIHPYAKHTIQLGPDGGSVLIVQETRGDMKTSIYLLSRLKRTVLTPTSLAAV